MSAGPAGGVGPGYGGVAGGGYTGNGTLLTHSIFLNIAFLVKVPILG